MPQHRFKKLNNGVWNPFEGTVGFSQQFWGEHIYAIQSDIPPTESVFAALDKSNATEVHTKMKISRGYDTFCPVQCGIAADKNPRIFFGGTGSITNGTRDDSFLFSKIAGETDGYFGYYIGGYYGQTGFNEIIAFKSSNGNASGYTVGQPILWRISSDVTGYIEAPDLEIYLVYSVRDDCYYWCVRSILNDYYRYWLCEYGYAVYAEDDDTGEKEEDTMITVPNLPSVDISYCGVSLFAADDWNNLFDYMWGTGDPLNAIYKLLGDETPYECILGMNQFPYGGDLIYKSSSENVFIGNVNTGVTSPTIKQFCQHDFGSVLVNRVYNNALDFAPYTSVDLYLPFIGTIRLPTDIVMGKHVGVIYNMDVLTGACCAYVTTDDIGVIKMEAGSCLIQCPISAKTLDGARQSISSAMGAGLSLASGNVISAIGSGISNAVSRDQFSSFGGLSLANGFLGLGVPILYITRPVDATPSGYNNIVGYPASAMVNLGTVSGFTQVKSINLGIAGASSEDLDEIEMLLKEGVIL